MLRPSLDHCSKGKVQIKLPNCSKKKRKDLGDDWGLCFEFGIACSWQRLGKLDESEIFGPICCSLQHSVLFCQAKAGSRT